MLTVTFHGARGVAPSPGPANRRYGTHTACVALEVDGEDPLLLDLGSGLARFAAAVGGGHTPFRHAPLGHTPFRGSALLTHLHRGHVEGLAGFAPLDQPGARLDVYGPRPDDGPLARVMAGVLGPRERLGILRFHEAFDEDFAVGQAKVMVRGVVHGGVPTNGYRVEWDGLSVAYVSDHGPPTDLSGVPEPVLELAAGVDLLIHDAQHSDAEWPDRAGDGHSPAAYAVQVAREAGARRLALFHHHPDRDDDALDRMLEMARRTGERLGVDEVVAAADGLVLGLGLGER
jgi:ribonuclease BN (tRNA processing enzyme)